MVPPRLVVSNVHKAFGTATHPVLVLKGVSLSLEPDESLAITGPSGCGKSTLLHIIGTLDAPTSGSVEIDGTDPFALRERELAPFRNRAVGFVFQDHHLLPQYSALENVLIPTIPYSGDRRAAANRAGQLIERVGLSGRQHHRPAELSGGERQRVAVARALITRPKLLLCDEPTGNLDEATAGDVADALFELHATEATALVIVTHSLSLAERCRSHVKLETGTCVEV